MVNIFVSDSVVAVNEAGSDELPRIGEPIGVGVARIGTFIVRVGDIENSVEVDNLSLVELVDAVPNESSWAGIIFTISEGGPERSVGKWLARWPGSDVSVSSSIEGNDFSGRVVTVGGISNQASAGIAVSGEGDQSQNKDCFHFFE